MTVCRKYEIAFGSNQKAHKSICLGCRRDSQSRKQNRCFKCVPFSSLMSLEHLWADVRFDIFRLADPGCHSIFGNNGKQYVFVAPGPPGTGAPRASDRTSFSAAAPENGPFWIDFAARASTSSAPLTNGTGSMCGESPTVTFLAAARNAVFSTCVRTGSLKRVAKIVLKPARASTRAANPRKVRKLCMYVMI